MPFALVVTNVFVTTQEELDLTKIKGARSRGIACERLLSAVTFLTLVTA
jgi:hypothetical protein